MRKDSQSSADKEFQDGMERLRAGDRALARSRFERAVKLDPKNADAWCALGRVHLISGRFPLATKAIRTAIEIRPHFGDAHFHLGQIFRQQNDIAGAASEFEASLRCSPNHADAAFELGCVFDSADQASRAENAFRHVLKIRPNHFDALLKLGELLRRAGRAQDALPLAMSAQRSNPADARAVALLANVLLDCGLYRESFEAAKSAVRLDPKNSAAWTTLGTSQFCLRDAEGAIPSLQKALELDPQNGNANVELGLVLDSGGDVDGARSRWRTGLAPKGAGERVRWLHALSLPAIYRDEEEIDIERQRFSDQLDRLHETIDLKNPNALREAAFAAQSLTPFFLHYQQRDNTALQCRFADLIDRVMAASAPELTTPCDWQFRSRDRIRVGIVSSHLMEHAVARYFRRMIASLDRSRFEVTVWYTGGVEDSSTRFIAAHVDQFIVTRQETMSLARTIRDARLDILIYPEIGMDPRHHALAALRLAPVQCALCGHPVTSGSRHIDYFLSGAELEPTNGDSHYRERLHRLPGLGSTPTSPPTPGDSSWFDAIAQNRPTILCMQNFLKLMPNYDVALARIAKSTGASILFLMRNAPLMRRFRARIADTFAEHGVDADRHLLFAPARQYADYMAGIRAAPLVLDSPGFSGGNTSLDAFGVSVPVVAWEGDMARGRQTSAMLRMMDLPQLIATNEDEYVARCESILRDRSERNSLADAIRDRHSLLFDDAAVNRAFADFLTTVTPRS